MNANKYVAGNLVFYYRQPHFGEPGNWAGADLVADWQRCYLHIYGNVMHLIRKREERVLLIYGAGHLG